jgi:formate dehydrogenase major subunit
MRNDTGKDILRALGNFPYLLGKQTGYKILIPSYEGNIYAGTVAGVHPDNLPGFDPVSNNKAIQKWNKNWNTRLSTSRGFSVDEMLANIGKDGISACMIAGDIPAQSKLIKLKFLVQLNMFRTPVSEYADVFLPVTGFLENEGHIMTLDGKIKKLKRGLPVQGNSRSIPAIISALAVAMNESAFPSTRPGSIWKEMVSHNLLSPIESNIDNRKFQLIKPISKKGRQKASVHSKVRHDHFRYRGNSLTTLIPDLKMVVDRLNNE